MGNWSKRWAGSVGVRRSGGVWDDRGGGHGGGVSGGVAGAGAVAAAPAAADFADLVVEISLIRPGPVQAGMVHPYLRRRLGQEPVRYLHPSLEPALRDTLGVIVFQEQVLKVAQALAGWSGGQGELLRRALGRKDNQEALARLRQSFRGRRGCAGRFAGRGRAGLQPTGGLRQLLLRQEPRRRLRGHRLPVGLAQALPPRALLRRPAQPPAHGLLEPGRAAQRRPPPRHRRAAGQRERQRRRLRARRRAAMSASAWPRCRGWARAGPSASWQPAPASPSPRCWTSAAAPGCRAGWWRI